MMNNWGRLPLAEIGVFHKIPLSIHAPEEQRGDFSRRPAFYFIYA